MTVNVTLAGTGGPRTVVAHVRAERAAGHEPRIDLVRGVIARLRSRQALERTSDAVRQLALLDRLGRG